MERIEWTMNGSRLGPNAWLNLSSGTLCENLHFLGGYGVKMHPGCFSQANVLQLTVAILQATVALSFQDLRLACGIPLWLLWSWEDWNMSHEFCQDKRLYILWYIMMEYVCLSHFIVCSHFFILINSAWNWLWGKNRCASKQSPCTIFHQFPGIAPLMWTSLEVRLQLGL